MWESKAWFVVERILSLLTLLVLGFAVWNSLLRIESRQAKQHTELNETLEAIRQRIGDETLWQSAQKSINDNSQK
jgi:hypothetical protein